MNEQCKNKLDLKFNELRIAYWEQFHKLPTFNEIDNAKSLLKNAYLC